MKVENGTPTGNSEYIIKKRINKIAKYVELDHKKVLDLGCGDGLYTLELTKKSKFVYGVDIEKKRLEKAKKMIKKENIKNIKIEMRKIEKKRYPKNYFDVILLNEVIEHFEDEDLILNEIFKILKPHGKLVIYAPNRLFPFEGHGLHFGRLKLNFPIPLLHWLPTKISKNFLRARTYTKNSITNLLKKHDFKIENVDYLFPPLDKFGKNYFIKSLRNLLSHLENTPFKSFGMSILIICTKT